MSKKRPQSRRRGKPLRSEPRSSPSEPVDQHRIAKALAMSVVKMARLNSKIKRLNKELEAKSLGRDSATVARKKISEDASADALLEAFGIEESHERTRICKVTRPNRSIILAEKTTKIAKLGRTMTILMQREYPLTWRRMLDCKQDHA